MTGSGGETHPSRRGETPPTRGSETPPSPGGAQSWLPGLGPPASAQPAAHGVPRTVRRLPGVRVGTSGYSFKDWTGPFYPPGIRPQEQLGYYARHFDCLEVNVTYYRVPDARLLASMERRTPADFDFIVKLHADMTHRQSRDADLYRTFREAMRPLRDAGKLKGLLAQFPWGFENTPDNRTFLAQLRERFPEEPLFVEFRNAGWVQEPLFPFLHELGLAYVSVDEPRLKGLVPPIARATTGTGYVRLHGRNARNWYRREAARRAAEPADAEPEAAAAPAAAVLREPARPLPGGGDRQQLRYDYLYSESELREWADKIKQLVQETRQVYVFFNNCHAGQAPVNAQAMKDLLQQIL